MDDRKQKDCCGNFYNATPRTKGYIIEKGHCTFFFHEFFVWLCFARNPLTSTAIQMMCQDRGLYVATDEQIF